MTLRAFILGLLAALLVAGGGYVNDSVLRLNFLVGNFFPVSVFGLLILIMLTANPLLHLLRPAWQLRPAELAVSLAMVLVACSIPGSSLMRTFTPALMMTIRSAQEPAMQDKSVLSYFPPQLLPGGGQYDPATMEGWYTGLGRPGSPIGLGEVPWAAWQRPLCTWGAMMALLGVCVICLSLVVHRQWSSHERLRYPIVDFAATLMNNDGRAVGPVFRHGLFWVGLCALLAYHGFCGGRAWQTSQTAVNWPLELNWSFILDKWPLLREGSWHGYVLVNPKLFPLVVAFAFFLSGEISLSLGLSTLAIALVSGIAVRAGANLGESEFAGGPLIWQRFGSYIGLALILLYIGRRYYRSVLQRAVGLGRSGAAIWIRKPHSHEGKMPSLLAGETPALQSCDAAEPYAVWAMRIGLATAAVLVWLLTSLGLPAITAALAVGIMLLVFLGVARMTAEAGLIYIQPWITPSAVLIGFLGYDALGPGAAATLAIVGGVLCYDARETLMPFVVNALRLADGSDAQSARPGPARMGPILAGVFVAGLAVALVTVVWANYNYGINRGDNFAMGTGGSITRVAQTAVLKTDSIAVSASLGSWGVLEHITPDPRFFAPVAAGIGAVLLLSLLRLRLPWWPLHPIIFLVWGTWAMDSFATSFFLGWMIKAAVTRFGGLDAYRRVKVLMIGIIAGDVLGGLVFMAIGAIYYLVTGQHGATYMILPP